MSERVQEEKICHCKNSKCTKLYCQCFSAGVQCSRNCRCLDCQNNKGNQALPPNIHNSLDRKSSKPQYTRENKGCSCRKSFCVKKYCECFQEGVLCNQHCKCVDCQNNVLLSNKNVIRQLKGTQIAARQCSLHPIILSQNPEHLDSLVDEQGDDPARGEWLNSTTKMLYEVGQKGDQQLVIEKLLEILSNFQNGFKRSHQDK